jgi:UDP-glucose-4-epimerase GalE
VLEAQRAGHECVVPDNLSRGHRSAIPTGTTLVEADVRDGEAVARALDAHKPDVVLHYAAFALVGESVENPDLYWDNNLGGTKSLLDAMAGSGRPTPLVFSSTCAVYGVPEALPMHEDLPKKPISPYGESKLACEELIANWCQATGAPAMALRYFNACGADPEGALGEEHDPETHLIPNVVKAALAGKEVVIFGSDFPTRDGTCVRDYVHVTDLAHAHLRAAEKLLAEARGFTALNLGTGRGYSNLDVVKAVEEAMGRPVLHRLGPRRPGDPAELYADPRRSREVLGFEPRYSDLATVVRTAHAWHAKKARL